MPSRVFEYYAKDVTHMKRGDATLHVFGKAG